MKELIKKLGSQKGLENIHSLLQKYAEGIVNPVLRDPTKEKYRSHLTTGMPVNSTAAAANKVLPPIQI